MNFFPLQIAITVCTAIVSFGCTVDSAVIPEAKKETSQPVPYPYDSQHFRFYYTSYDSSVIRSLADSLEQHYQRITEHFVVDTMPKVNVYFYSTQEQLMEAVRPVVPDLPSWAIGLATASDQIHMLSPKHPNYDYGYMRGVLVHEFAHSVTLHLRPNFGNNPRWLWESVAIYESGQFIHPNNLSYMVNNAPPTLTQMNSFNNSFVYEVGYLIGEYIVAAHGYGVLKQLVMTNGNLSSTLGMTTAQFQTAWFNFAKNKYGF